MATSFDLPLQQIKVDGSLQPRQDGLDESQIESLLQTPKAWPPIVVVAAAEQFLLVDGFHRYHAAKRLGNATILAVAIDRPSDGDLFRVAFEINAAHGLRLSLRDRKAYAAHLIRFTPELADREIGRRSGLHHETVGALREEGPRADRYRAPSFSERKPGDIDADVGLLDPIRRARGATRPQKAVAGYLKRLGASLFDPYGADGSAVEGWSEDPLAIASACFAAMGPAKADALLTDLEFAAGFVAKIGRARKDPTLRAQVKKGN